ncbi:hypothetical protein Pcinc_030820 [Petrolisthes cinctipes]|uniref:Peptidase A2 domain-containing protein n=1 Tax=Petrolisthes cinctipes TaxID=88211 RepID=A0AAE1K5S8_PETCI|nr:hypothetical protein Pcinc_030820 [Petrolisthes cinctipes]
MCWVPRGGRVRLVGGLWLLVSFVIATVYRSNLKAMLILPKIQLPFTTFEQLAATDIHVVFVKGSLVDHALSKAVPNSTLDRLKGQTRVSTGLLSNVSAISQGMTAGFGVFSALRQLMHNSFSRSGYCRLYVTTEGILHSSVALAFPKGSPLLPKFNKIVWRLKEFGLLQHLYHNEVANASECIKPVTATTTTTDLRPLELGDFYGVFSVYAGVFPQCFPPTLLMTSQCTSHDLLVLLKCDNSPHPPIYNLNTLIATTTGGLVRKHVTVPTHVVGRGAVNTLPAATLNSSRQLLFVLDSTSRARFLVDTGATVSAVPPSTADKATEYPSYDLLAANGTSIATYGTRTLNLDLGLPEKVIWSFIVADVRHPILGLDFLHSQDILVDSRYQQLHHRPTTCTIKATPCAEVTPRITHISPEPAYTSLLQEFPELTSTTPHSGRKRHNVMHRIITQGQPCFERPRRLPPERLQAAKKEFEQLLQEADPLPSISLNYTDIARVQSTDNELQSLLEEGTALRLQRHAIPGTQQPLCYVRLSMYWSDMILTELPYDGPFRVLNRTPKYITIDKNGRADTVTIDRIKPAYTPLHPATSEQNPPQAPTVLPPPTPSRPILISLPPPHNQPSRPPLTQTLPQSSSAPHPAQPQPTQHKTQPQLLSSPHPAQPQPTQLHETQTQSPASPQPTQQHETQHESLEFPTLTPNIRQPTSPPSPQPVPPQPRPRSPNSPPVR